MKKETIDLINYERSKQDAQWGGIEHDKLHTPIEWASYIHYQASMVSQGPPNSVKQRLAKIAALAVAALEAMP